jgi:phage shock protein PspC (stress-responsive transcriptional regulator)
MTELPDRSDRPRLRRSRHERVLFGVCGGVAEYFGLDPTIVRVGFVLVTLFPPTSIVGLLGYVLLAILLPEEGSEHLPARERVQRNLTGIREDVGGLTDTVRSGLGRGSRDRAIPSDEMGTTIPEREAIDHAAEGAGRYET